ncbi:putative accessory protein [Chrysanthemum yellow dwarf virus]|uniref:Accessory protein n=1 Tax=chrysanthemum yellow dwarf associated virus TaxID=3070829 RepID=A0AAE7UGW5_9RHAB|nr:putative accessory protein [Chrysanthemum yellow dwarf virus]QRX38981.1 putative accessory protein [Chrysanthemum yellow dwarf virus]
MGVLPDAIQEVLDNSANSMDFEIPGVEGIPLVVAFAIIILKIVIILGILTFLRRRGNRIKRIGVKWT